jgi:hypothetical protein
MNRSQREIIFFVLVFLVFYLAVKFSEYFIQKSGIHGDFGLLIVGLLYSLAIVAIYNLAKLKSNEGFWDVSLPAQCKGGPFFYQGDSELSKRCRALAETPEGKIALSGYNCPIGYVGQPGMPFYYTPLSDDNWKNERCQDRPNCPLVDTGDCSLKKQLP